MSKFFKGLLIAKNKIYLIKMKSFSGSETDESSETSEDAHENGLKISLFKFLLILIINFFRIIRWNGIGA